MRLCLSVAPFGPNKGGSVLKTAAHSCNILFGIISLFDSRGLLPKPCLHFSKSPPFWICLTKKIFDKIFHSTSSLKKNTVFNRPGAGLESYIGSMQRLQKAVEFFNKNNPDSPEMAQVVSHFICTLKPLPQREVLL